jgi:hypothetical protein
VRLPGTTVVAAFALALITVFAWPWVLPKRILNWMDG